MGFRHSRHCGSYIPVFGSPEVQKSDFKNSDFRKLKNKKYKLQEFRFSEYSKNDILVGRKDNALCVALFFYRGLYTSRSEMEQPGMVHILTNISTFAVGDVIKSLKF